MREYFSWVYFFCQTFCFNNILCQTCVNIIGYISRFFLVFFFLIANILWIDFVVLINFPYTSLGFIVSDM